MRKGRESFRMKYTFSGNLVTVQIAILLFGAFSFLPNAPNGLRNEPCGRFSLYMIPKQVRRSCHKRFSIKTSCRCVEQLGGWTTSRNPVPRFFFISVPFILLNRWQKLRWQLAQPPRRDDCLLGALAFPMRCLVRFIREALESHFGVLYQIAALCVPID